VVAGGPASGAFEQDPEVRRLHALARRHGVDDRTTFLGAVGHEDVPALISSVDVVACPPWYEPFGIVPVEAMSCGRPVVGTAVGGLLDTIEPGLTGDLVPPRDPAALAVALAALLRDRDRRRAYGEAGRARAVERYDWRRVVASTEVVYREVVAEGARAFRRTTGVLS
jgi:glycosyltransferase involved in cell wall biosynthesis